MNLSKATILDVCITTASESVILSEIETAVNARAALFITTPNPEIVVEAQKNNKLREALSHSDISLPDGTGIILALKLLGISIPRIRGREFFEKLLISANKNKWRAYLLGASEESNRKSTERIEREYSNIHVSKELTHTLIVNEKGIAENEKSEQDLIKEVQTFSPHLLFVAFGHPKQELWTDRRKKYFPGTTIMTIGGTLDYFSGTVPSPPRVISQMGMEWLFRLLSEPQRWKRIITAVVVFPYLFFFTFIFKSRRRTMS